MKQTRLASTILLIGLSLSLSGQFRTAKRSADKAFELHAYHLAIEGYLRALELRQDDTETLSRLGDSYRMLNLPDSARIYYDRALEGSKVASATLFSYGQTLKSLGEYELALPVFAAFSREANREQGNHFAASCDFAMKQRDEPAGFVVEPLGLNSTAADFGPNLAIDGQFVFSSSRVDEDFSGSTVANRPYVAQVQENDDLATPVPVAFDYRSDSGSNGPVSYSPDGSQVVFTRNNFAAGVRMVPEAGITLTLMIADVNGAGQWTNVRPLPMNGSSFNTGFGTFASDGQSIYFASDRPGGYGGYDIYKSRRIEGGWQATPEIISSVVNSPGNEITPFHDGDNLYFSSNYHQGLGNYDVFRAEYKNGAPALLYHLGGAVNSPRDDMGFVYDADRQIGYFTSNRDGERRQEDLFRATYGGTIDPALDSGLASGPTDGRPDGVAADAPVPFGTVRGYVTNLRTNEAIANASVVVIDRNDGVPKSMTTDSEGAYYLDASANSMYDVEVEAEGYETISFPVATPASPPADIFGNIQLLPVQRTDLAIADTTTAPAASADTMTTAPPPAPTVDATQEVAEEGLPNEGFAVQLASMGKEPALSNYANLSSVGKVYSRRVGDAYKVRLGPFRTRQDAEEAAARAGEAGYAGAFVVRAEAPARSPELSSTSDYRIQLGAYSRPESFDRAKAAALGELKSERRGELTVFYVIAATEDAAVRIRSEAESAGFEGAYVLRLMDGKYTKL